MPEVPTRMGGGSEAEVGTTQGAWPPKTWESWGPPRCSCRSPREEAPGQLPSLCKPEGPGPDAQAAPLPSLPPPPKDKTRCSAWGMKLLITPALSGGFVPSLLRWFSEDIPGPMSGHCEVPN